MIVELFIEFFNIIMLSMLLRVTDMSSDLLDGNSVESDFIQNFNDLGQSTAIVITIYWCLCVVLESLKFIYLLF